MLRRGDVVTLLTSGGGGCGDPDERPPELTRSDVENGYMPEAGRGAG